MGKKVCASPKNDLFLLVLWYFVPKLRHYFFSENAVPGNRPATIQTRYDTDPLQYRSGAFDDGSLPVLQYGAPLRALKISIECAQTLPFGSTPLFTFIGHLHPEHRLQRENQPIRTSTFEKILCGIELLRTLNSFNPTQSPD